jgi:hypothetical protein
MESWICLYTDMNLKYDHTIIPVKYCFIWYWKE